MLFQGCKSASAGLRGVAFRAGKCDWQRPYCHLVILSFERHGKCMGIFYWRLKYLQSPSTSKGPFVSPLVACSQAPEVLMGGRCTEKADVFSYGVILWELVTGERPSRGGMHPPRSGLA